MVLAFSFVPVAVFAHEGEEHSGDAPSPLREGAEGDGLKQRLLELKEERQANKQERLEANKLRVCEQREAKIKAIMTRSITRAEKQLALFDKIAERVKGFYVDKGRTVANYDELVAAVDAAKAAAEANLETLKNLEAFDCDAEDPKGNAEAFKLALKSINSDLKDYRAAVNNLIVGVKSAQSQEGGEQ